MEAGKSTRSLKHAAQPERTMTLVVAVRELAPIWDTVQKRHSYVEVNRTSKPRHQSAEVGTTGYLDRGVGTVDCCSAPLGCRTMTVSVRLSLAE